MYLWMLPSSNNPLELAKRRLQLSKLSFITKDIMNNIVYYLSKIYNCSHVIEIKCSSSTSISKEWKLQLLFYMCMNNCNKGRLFNIMKGIYWECILPQNINKQLFLERMYSKANKIKL